MFGGGGSWVRVQMDNNLILVGMKYASWYLIFTFRRD